MPFITTESPNSVERFQRSCAWQTVSVVYFIFAKFLSSKGALLPAKKKNFRISCKFAHLHIMSFITTTFHEFCRAVSEEFHWHKTGLKNGLTDWRLRTDGSKTLFPPQLVAWGITISRLNTSTCIRYILVAFPMVRFNCFLTSILFVHFLRYPCQ